MLFDTLIPWEGIFTKTPYVVLMFHMHATCPVQLLLLNVVVMVVRRVYVKILKFYDIVFTEMFITSYIFWLLLLDCFECCFCNFFPCSQAFFYFPAVRAAEIYGKSFERKWTQKSRIYHFFTCLLFECR